MIVTNQAKDHLVMAVEAHVVMVEDKPDWKSLRESFSGFAEVCLK